MLTRVLVPMASRTGDSRAHLDSAHTLVGSARAEAMRVGAQRIAGHSPFGCQTVFGSRNASIRCELGLGRPVLVRVGAAAPA